MTITAAKVKELREKTGVGMMDCKKALAENDGDMEAAIDWLRAKGLSKAAKKADRVASEGLVGIVVDGTKGAAVEVNSETDFVARNDQFQEMVASVAKLALDSDGNTEKLMAMEFPGKSMSVEDYVKEAIATIGENMSVRRAATLSVDEGVVAGYVHNKVDDGLGKIGVLVALKSSADADKLNEFGRQLAMHVAATNPLALTPDDLDPEAIEKERAIYTEQAEASGKPAEIVAKMVEGRLRKEFFQQAVLLQQVFVLDGKASVQKALDAASKEAGAPIEIAGFVRFALGEGIEKKEDDFAAEVAAAAGGN